MVINACLQEWVRFPLCLESQKNINREATKEKNIPRHWTFGPLTNKTFDGFQRENFTLFFIKGEIYFFNHFLFSLCSFSLPRFLVHLSVCFFKPSVLKSTDLWGTDVFFYFIWCREFLNSLLILSPWLPGNSGLRFILCFIQLHFFLADFFFFFGNICLHDDILEYWGSGILLGNVNRTSGPHQYLLSS